jgi:UDP-N-acetylglucosamine:LPS N-acetylglucosamine transferase
MTDPQILLVTSAGAPSSAVVPVLAAIEAAGMRVRAIDVGAAGGGGGGMADRVRRALMGEGAERRLRRELEVSQPDAAVVFDPHAALALTVARDGVPNPTPVIAVVGELDPSPAWAQSDADRFVAVDDLAAVALADAGVEGERILVVGAIGERAFADAATQDRAALRTRFKLGGKVALVEVAGLGAEHTGQLALQLSLLDGGDQITFLFDAANDIEAAAVLRRQVPTLGLRAKLFGATADAPLLWRAADVIVARPRAEVVSRVMLVGGKLVALVDDSIANAAKTATALEARRRAIPARGLLLLSSALEGAFSGAPPGPTGDGGDNVADIVFAVAGDKRGIIDERRAAAQAATRDRVRAASAAAQAAAQTTAMPGDLEDLGGGPAIPADEPAVPDAAEIARLRAEVERRKSEMTRSMMASREAATQLSDQAKAARDRGAADEAAQLERRADAERARMHAMLGELATLESELAELERVRKTVGDIPRTSARPRATATASPDPADYVARHAPSIDDALNDLKRKAGAAPSSSTTGRPTGGRTPRPPVTTVDDELAALKRKMQAQKKK